MRLVALFGLLAACGSPAAEEKRPFVLNQPCATGERMVEAFRYDTLRECRTRMPEPVVCTTASAGGTGNAVCVRHRPTGQVFLGTSGSDFTGTDWEPCPDELTSEVVEAPDCP